MAPGFASLRGQVFDAASGRPLAARIEIRDAKGEAVGSYYARLPGLFTEEDGTFEVPLRPGRYSVEVHHGIDHVSEKTDVEVADGRGVALHASLAPW